MADFAHAGPYLENEDTVEKNMLQVVLALIPALIAAVVFFGVYSLYLALGTALFSTIIEFPFAADDFSRKRPFGDGSAFLAGLLLGLTLPPGAPWWIPLAGAFFTIVLGKQVFGGLGNNIFNPALVGRAVLLLSWLEPMTAWKEPYNGITEATPLARMLVNGGEIMVDYGQLLLGNIAGSIGETSALALLLGAFYLYLKGYISWRIPGGYIIAAGVLSFLLGFDPLYAVLSGGLLFGALFMASDMVTSPVTHDARLIYGLGCGIFTVLIRHFTVYPEGVTFAILLMNGAAYFLDTVLEGPRFGQMEKRKQQLKTLGSLLLIIIVFLGMTGGVSYLVNNYLIEEQPFAGVDGSYRGSGEGVYGEIKVEVVVENSDVKEITVVSHDDTTDIAEPAFEELEQQIIESQELDVDTVSGATMSSEGFLEAVADALLSERQGALHDEQGDGRSLSGVFRGTGAGLNSDIEVEVTIAGDVITDIAVIAHDDTADIAEPVFEELEQQIIESQELDVDTVSGATVSSEGFLEAVAEALLPKEEIEEGE